MVDRRYKANDPGSRRTLIRFFKLLLPFEIRFLLCKNHKVSILVLEYSVLKQPKKPLW